MAGNTTSNHRKKRSQEKPSETEVILIVKGAGEQAEDDHLNIFLRGFWPAVKSLDKNATIRQAHLEEFGDKRITEIRAKLPPDHDGGQPGEYVNKRIWLKESYWEYDVLASTALGNLSKEWQLSSHVFVNMFQDLFFTRDTNARKNDLTGKSKRTENLYRAGVKPEENIYKEFLKPKPWDLFGSYFSYTLLFLLVFLPLIVTPFIEPGRMTSMLAGVFPSVIVPGVTKIKEIYGVIFAFAIALLWALAPARELWKMINLRFENQSNENLKRIPGLPNWTLVLLIFLLLMFPVSYLLVLLFVLSVQIALLFARRILWKYRYYSNSDVDRAKEYYRYKIIKDGETKDRIGKVDEAWLLRLPFSPMFYRYFIFLALPIGFLITTLAGFLKWTRLLGGFGEALDGFIKFMLVGYMDDVVNYATDPVQAYRVRNIVMEDIRRFHGLNNGKEVQRIHVVAHSQGTPITFETLFHYLDPGYQTKIYTYVTLGSVLSYYYQARGALDPVYYNRFKMPIREDKFPGWEKIKSPQDKKFPENKPYNFKWLNFWNFTDPITEFYGLDEYNWFSGKWTIDKDTNEETPARGYTSPVNIRTGSSLSKNHGEYWDNLDRFQKPFAKRILGDFRPKEWNAETTPEWKARWFPEIANKWVNRKIGHHLAVLLLSPVTLALLLGTGFGVYWFTHNVALGYFHDIFTFGAGAFNEVFPSTEGSEPNLIQRIFAPATITFISQLWGKILAGTLVILGIWAVFDWASQLIRAYKLGHDDHLMKDDSKPDKTKA